MAQLTKNDKRLRRAARGRAKIREIGTARVAEPADRGGSTETLQHL